MSWIESQRQSIERFGEGMERGWASTVDFWKHLVMVKATVLGLTVGLLAVGREGTPAFLVVAWVALLLGIFVGCVLIRAGLAADLARKLAAFRATYDLAEIQGRVAAGTLAKDSDEWLGLSLAAIMLYTPKWEHAKTFQPGADEIAAPWHDKLPSARFVKARRSRFQWLDQHIRTLEAVFYGLSVAAFLAMILVVARVGR